MSSAVVKARISGADEATLEYADNEPLIGSATVAGIEGDDSVWTFELTGLAPATDYWWTIEGWSEVGHLRTPSTPGTAHSFTVAAGSCAGHSGAEYDTAGNDTSNAPTFARILDRDPDLFIHLGDIHYRDISTNTPSLYRQGFRDVLANPLQAELYRNVPIAYVWDDHDFGPNNSNSTSAGKPAAQQVYREYVPHHTLPDADEIYQTFVIGRVRFNLLDVRSERSLQSATDNSSKTMLGATQKQWLKDTLLAATEPCIVLATVVPWSNDTTAGSDSWAGYNTERVELADYFEANDLTARLLILCGDMHRLFYEDGPGTQYGTGSVNDGPPVFLFAPLDGGFTGSGGWTVSQQQYGTLDFDDDGTDITVTGKGWAVSDATETEVFSEVHVY